MRKYNADMAAAMSLFDPTNYRPLTRPKRKYTTDHKHPREIARRLRQEQAKHSKYMLNGGFTRRGNEAGEVAYAEA